MFWKEIHETWWKTAIAFLVFCTLAVSGPGLFWYMENNAEMMAQLKAVPPDLIGNLTDYQAIVFSNWFGKNLVQMGTIFAVILGAGAIAGEVAKRTLEFTLSKPVSRLRVLLTKVVVGVTALGIAILLASILLYPASLILGQDISLASLFLAGVLGWLGLAVLYALALLFSTIFDDVIKTAIVSLVVAFALSIPGWFTGIARFSLYNHMQNFVAFQQGTFPVGDAAILVAVFAALVSGSYLIFRAKEF
ncbi:MAG: ABC transporter permease subunit [Dehalococcoidia bacterium]|nr:ABC transporter permease subunit [Dehalococcoidia bacterium]